MQEYERLSSPKVPVKLESDVPYLMYDIYCDHSTLARAAHFKGEHLEPSCHYIVGNEAITHHLLSITEQYELNQDVSLLIDALVIIEAFPDDYPPLDDNLYDYITNKLIKTLEEADKSEAQSLCIHAMSVQKLYDALTLHVNTWIRESKNLDETLQESLIEGYLSSYAEIHLSEGGKIEALRRVLLDLK